jgi:hypothetical protein
MFSAVTLPPSPWSASGRAAVLLAVGRVTIAVSGTPGQGSGGSASRTDGGGVNRFAGAGRCPLGGEGKTTSGSLGGCAPTTRGRQVHGARGQVGGGVIAGRALGQPEALAPCRPVAAHEPGREFAYPGRAVGCAPRLRHLVVHPPQSAARTSPTGPGRASETHHDGCSPSLPARRGQAEIGVHAHWVAFGRNPPARLIAWR